MRIRIIAAGLTVGAVALTGCMPGTSSGGSDRSAKAVEGSGHGETPAKGLPAAEDDGGKSDVKIDDCSVGGVTGWPAAKLTVTNHSSTKANYIISIEFVDSSGTRLGTGAAAENGLAPKQQAKVTAQGVEKVSGKVTCKVVTVGRYPSP
ncbi:FxLYD domain-containing protein [Streptomyces sp. x-80]|uniref:FxLYD domain-containing protein n=1 Tax=Streptomyces sp. x-80 TaxID=2789282 RepID=UPI003980C63B